MEINLALNKHCIQTEARHCYEQLIKRYFKRSKNHEDLFNLEQKMVALKYFLENADFSYLRRTCPELSGGRQAVVRIHISVKEKKMSVVHNENIITLEAGSLDPAPLPTHFGEK